MMRTIIAAGGTGGHIYPALAIANQLRSSYGAQVLFVGTPRGLESRIVPQAGYELSLIRIGQFNQVPLRTKLRTLFDLPFSLLHCRKLLRDFRPHVVVGVGGYASGPVMAAAILTRLPTLAVEPNAMPGLANRVIGKRVRAAAINFEAAAKYFRNPEVTGIPVRGDFFRLAQRPAGAPSHLLVFGGSQGARALNILMPQIVAQLLNAVPGLTILHQAGARHADATLAAYFASGAPSTRWQVLDFLDDMPRRFEAADLVLSRSGASTVAELAAAGKPSLLIPFPQSADDHQRRNAEAFVAAGASQIIVEADLSPALLLDKLTALLADRATLGRMSAQARKLAHADAAKRIVSLIEQLAQQRPVG
jgi:UDP-N-acetylglucosamine--N-acetylmuramyl-(pentapeptide) pyrophosphoryl-undecaprenol N-acetylglucosamine transferase